MGKPFCRKKAAWFFVFEDGGRRLFWAAPDGLKNQVFRELLDVRRQDCCGHGARHGERSGCLKGRRIKERGYWMKIMDKKVLHKRFGMGALSD